MNNFTVIETILRDRTFFFSEIRDGVALWDKVKSMLISCMAFLAVYGAVMGASHGLLQALSSFVKLPILFLVTLVICTPSLYFFNLLFGSKQTLAQNVALILTAMTTTAVLLVSFAPIILFFLLTTSQYEFFKLLNVGVFAISGIMGVLFLRQGRAATADPHNMEGVAARRVIFVLWIILYAFVGSQMAWTLSPFMGDPNMPFMVVAQRGGNFYADVIASIRHLLGV